MYRSGKICKVSKKNMKLSDTVWYLSDSIWELNFFYNNFFFLKGGKQIGTYTMYLSRYTLKTNQKSKLSCKGKASLWEQSMKKLPKTVGECKRQNVTQRDNHHARIWTANNNQSAGWTSLSQTPASWWPPVDSFIQHSSTPIKQQK